MFSETTEPKISNERTDLWVSRENTRADPSKRILLVLDNFSSHVCEHTRKRAHQLGIDLVFLPVSSLGLNPLEQV